MSIDLVKKYLRSIEPTLPFFLFVSDRQYADTKAELSSWGLDFIPLSQFCGGDDKIPDIDKLLAHIQNACNRIVVTGLGEFLALSGKNEAKGTLARIKDLNVGAAKVVLLLRGLSSLIPILQADPRFDSRRFSVLDKAECDLTFTLAAPSVGGAGLPCFKTMLEKLERGECGNVVANTAINFNNSIFTVRRINNAYEGVKLSLSGSFALPRSCGNDKFWAELLNDLNQNNGSLDGVFEKHGLGKNPEVDFYPCDAGSDYRTWLYFISLKCKDDTIQSGYLRYVLDKTICFEKFAENVLNSIIDIAHTDKRFDGFYRERKKMLGKFSEPKIAEFVKNNRKIVAESVYKLTDGTIAEKEEIIAWVSQHGLVNEVETIYPALARYLRKYSFKCPDLAELLTEYFEAYKRQKLANQIEPEFLEKVDKMALSRQFNRLQTRNELLDRLDKTETYLYWLDALGVEYLGFIESLAEKHGLWLRVNIARAELPTITRFNRDFYDTWQGFKEKNNKLDEIKHKDNGGYNFIDNELPIHLAKELDIIEEMMNKAASLLAARQHKRFLIVSDHGASRLAVLRRKEEKYQTETKGEHSGRCCPLFQPYDLPYAAEENGYLVLADYGRFKGSRAASVEVHGGASLEEVVVPVIELSLKEGCVTVELVEETATVDYRTGVELELFFNAIVQDVYVDSNGKRYQASKIDMQHYAVKLPDIKRAGEYPADVYAGDNLIGHITIKAQGKSAKINNEFENLF